MSGILCVGGGVLLATVFMHMIPEVRESLETARKLNKLSSNNTTNSHENHEDEHNHPYPLAELVVCAGFFIIYLIEALVNHIFGLDGHSHGPPKPKNEIQNVENGGGIVNMAFNDTSNGDGPIRSPPDTPNTTGVSDSKTICSPETSQDNHPDNVDATISPFGFKYK